MNHRRCLAMICSVLAILATTAVLAQRPAPGGDPAVAFAPTPPARALKPGAFGVKLLLGLNDAAPKSWSGKVSLDRGTVLGVEGGRFHAGDALEGPSGWRARSVLVRKAAAKAANKKKANAVPKAGGGPSTQGGAVAPQVVTVWLDAPNEATLGVATDEGDFDVPLAELATGAPRQRLNGRVVLQRVPRAVPLVVGPGQQDFPSATPDGSNGAWVVYVEHQPRGPEVLSAYKSRPMGFAALAPTGGGDQIKLIHVDAAGAIVDRFDVTDPGLDVWKPAVALDGKSGVVVVWSEQRQGDFELYRRRLDAKSRQWSDANPGRLTTNPGADTSPALATAGDGTVWLAWQQWRDGKARVVLGKTDAVEQSSRDVGTGEGNAWSPALAVSADGTVHVGYDTYQSGNYDIHVRSFRRDGTATSDAPVVVAGSPRYEANPSLAVDSKGRLWVAYEERTADWGKDAENLVKGEGSTLYREAAVRVRVVDGTRVLAAPDPLGEVPEGRPLRAFNSYPRIASDAMGRVWLAFRHRQEAIWGNNAVMVVGGVWIEHLTSLEGSAWAYPRPVPNTDNLLDNRPAFVTRGSEPPLLVSSSDGRLRREVEHSPELTLAYYSHSGTPPGVVDNDLFLAVADARPGAGAGEPVLTAIEPAAGDPPAAIHENESADVARMRDYRVEAGGKTYRFLRGDFHRHTELSQDGGSDGSLEDMWRYAIDAAGFDWMGNADHDNGGSKEYTWWLVQKSTDLYHGPRLTTMFTYERSVSYPHGHRNVMFAQRGVRTLPRLVEPGRGVVDADTTMLYDYLKEHDGICASHTSATGMGTDWRDVNPALEPIVEIYQGHRNSYEHYGAPRVARRPSEAIGGWQPLGMVWNALAMQYRVGFQASSDHISTHISYAVALAEDASRAAVLDAFKKRHCYGATDNIVLDVRTADGNHLMGDAFDLAPGDKLRLKVHAIGTRPIARVDVIKDFVYAYSTEPKTADVAFEWTDTEDRPPGTSWYYVRVIQDDGQLAWGSPLWVRSAARP